MAEVQTWDNTKLPLPIPRKEIERVELSARMRASRMRCNPGSMDTFFRVAFRTDDIEEKLWVMSFKHIMTSRFVNEHSRPLDIAAFIDWYNLNINNLMSARLKPFNDD